jgi:hypothetical protein
MKHKYYCNEKPILLIGRSSQTSIIICAPEEINQKIVRAGFKRIGV